MGKTDAFIENSNFQMFIEIAPTDLKFCTLP